MRKWDGEMLVMLMEQGVEMLVERDMKIMRLRTKKMV
jgi:hypothetical protein